jgi:hypothetical protein
MQYSRRNKFSIWTAFLFHPLRLRVNVAMVLFRKKNVAVVLRSEELDDQIPYDID